MKAQRIVFVILSAFLGACSLPIAPVELIEQVPETVVSEQATPHITQVQNRTMLYKCQKGKQVSVTHTAQDKKTVLVEFDKTSHKLSSSLPKGRNYKKYSNIRWIWSEDFKGKANLRDKSGRVLAQECITEGERK